MVKVTSISYDCLPPQNVIVTIECGIELIFSLEEWKEFVANVQKFEGLSEKQKLVGVQ
jgi:hypothetical protein